MTPAKPKHPRRLAKAEQPRRVTKAEQFAVTRAALIDTARELFGERGFAAVGTEEIVRKAGVTRGALYHHFKDKNDLFTAVYEQIEAESIEAVAVAVSGQTDPWQAAMVGAGAYLDFCMDPSVQRILINDGPAVIDEATRHEIVERYGSTLMRAMIEGLIAVKAIKPQPVEALVAVLTGALVEGATAIARADDPKQMRDDIAVLLERLLSGLK